MRTRSKVSNGERRRPTSNSTLFEYRSHVSDHESSQSVIIFTKHDHQQLQSPRFLNDTIISFFMQYHLDQRVDPELKSRIHIFNSFFFAKINSISQRKKIALQTYENTSRWLKSVKIFSKDFLIMPVCEREHWLLIIVCYPANSPRRDQHKIPDEELYEPAVFVLNSCAGLAPSIKKALSHFLKFQWQQEHGTTRTFSINHAKQNGIRLLFPDLPQQKNSYNCGVYLLGYFYSFLNNPRQAYITMFRNRSLKTWFQDNNIDISRERSKMINVVKNKISMWTKSEKSDNHEEKHALGSQEALIDLHSPSDTSEIIEDDRINSANHTVIVIH